VRGGPIEGLTIHAFKAAQELKVVAERSTPGEPSALLLESLEDVRWLVRKAPEVNATVRAVLAPHIPSGAVQMLSGLGILALAAEPAVLARVKDQGKIGRAHV